MLKTTVTMWVMGMVIFAGVQPTVWAEDLPPVRTVEKVDIQKYMGLWYEIARYPTRFQKNCYKATAEYALLENGDVRVTNRCRRDGPDGEIKQSVGKAWLDDRVNFTKLRVQFFWPFHGAYWVIDLGKNYEYAVVGEPDREYLWILSRTPTLPEKVYQGILTRLKEQHYDVSKLISE